MVNGTAASITSASTAVACPSRARAVGHTAVNTVSTAVSGTSTMTACSSRMWAGSPSIVVIRFLSSAAFAMICPGQRPRTPSVGKSSAGTGEWVPAVRRAVGRTIDACTVS